MDALLPSHPESYTKLIKRSLKLYAASFKRIILLTLLLSIVAFLPRLLSDLIGQDIFADLSLLSPQRLWLIVIELVGIAFFISIIWRMHCIIHGLHESLMDDFRVALRKIFSVLVASIIQSLFLFAVILIIFGTLLLQQKHSAWLMANQYGFLLIYFSTIIQFLLLIYVISLFIFMIPLISIEDKGVLSAIKRSIYLGWNHSWRIISTQITPWIFYIITMLIIKFVFRIDIHIYLTEQGPHSILTTLLHILIFALYIPWIASLLLVQLKDLELRKHINSNI